MSISAKDVMSLAAILMALSSGLPKKAPKSLPNELIAMLQKASS